MATFNTAQLRRRAMKRKFVMNLRDNGGFYMEPGLYPLQRASSRSVYDNESPYLHSSVEGFNKEYEQIGASLAIVNELRTLRKVTLAYAKMMAEQLVQRAQTAKQQVFGINSNADIMTAPAVQLLYNKQSVINELRQRLYNLKFYAMDPYTIKNVQVLDQQQEQIISLKQQTVAQRAVEMKQKIEALLNWLDAGDPDHYLQQNDLKAFLQDTVRQLNDGATPFGLKYDPDVLTTQVNFHQKLGYIWESILQTYLNLAIQKTVNKQDVTKAIVEKIQKTGLDDIMITLIGEDNLTQQVALSAKFHTTNSFDITARGAQTAEPRSIQNIITTIPGSNNVVTEKALHQLQYFYNNWIALSIFSSESTPTEASQTWVSGDRKYEQARQRKRGRRLLTGSSFKQVFTALADCIYIIMVMQALFGNIKDINSTKSPLVNKKYMLGLLQKAHSGEHIPPAFLFTSQRAFETGQLFNMIIQNAQKTNAKGNDNIHQSIVALFNAFATPSTYSATAFEELYHEKCEALIAASNSGLATTIYDTLFEKDIRTVRNFNPFKQWFTRDMVITMTFDPSKYIR